MSLNDNEIFELDRLLLERGLYKFDDDTNPNYKFLYESLKEQQYDARDKLLSGYAGIILEGSSRSGKTWSAIDLIIYICLFVETECDIFVVRETYAEFETTLYSDFKKRLNHFQLPHPFDSAQKVKTFKIGNNRISFLGADKIGKKLHGSGSDYIFFNEILHIPQRTFRQLTMRCRKFWWGDYNPNVTEHWVFDSVETRPDVGFLRTTFKDNPYITPAEKNEILRSEPWLPGSYQIIDSVIYYNNKIVDKNNQPPPHPTNIDQGTADEFDWKVYGLGLRGAMKGIIFPHVTWIEEFPEMAYTYANDFGFTADPNVLGKYAEDEHNIWVEPMMYSPCDNDIDLGAYFESVGVEKDLPIACDSSDKYTGENKGTVEMVKGLKRQGFSAFKISKKKSVMYWLGSMKKKKIHIVKNKFYTFVKKEKENYRMKEIHGIAINQPIDKWNHFWDMVRYGHMSHNMPTNVYKTEKTLSQMGINY